MRERREPARRPVANDGAFVGDERGGRDQRERRESGKEVKKVGGRRACNRRTRKTDRQVYGTKRDPTRELVIVGAS